MKLKIWKKRMRKYLKVNKMNNKFNLDKIKKDKQKITDKLLLIVRTVKIEL